MLSLKKVALFFCLFFITINFSYWNFSNHKVNNILNKFYFKVSKQPIELQYEAYFKVLSKIYDLKKDNSINTDILSYIEDSINNKVNNLIDLNSNIYSKNKLLILRLKNDDEYNDKYIEKYKKDIESADAIFLFRYWKNINSDLLKNTTNNIKKLNSDILLFIVNISIL